MVYIVPLETCSRGHRAEGHCNYELTFGSWVILALFASVLLEITGRREGMGWDGEGIKNLGTWALYVDYLRYDLICLA